MLGGAAYRQASVWIAFAINKAVGKITPITTEVLSQFHNIQSEKHRFHQHVLVGATCRQ